VKHLVMQTAINAHLSQSTGAGALAGQQGMSLVISSAAADGDISSDVACIEASKATPAMTGRESGAKARPTIVNAASSRRMARVRFTRPSSHKPAARESHRRQEIGSELAPLGARP
jgi:hypothetical protein